MMPSPEETGSRHCRAMTVEGAAALLRAADIVEHDAHPITAVGELLAARMRLTGCPTHIELEMQAAYGRTRRLRYAREVPLLQESGASAASMGEPATDDTWLSHLETLARLQERWNEPGCRPMPVTSWWAAAEKMARTAAEVGLWTDRPASDASLAVLGLILQSTGAGLEGKRGSAGTGSPIETCTIRWPTAGGPGPVRSATGYTVHLGSTGDEPVLAWVRRPRHNFGGVHANATARVAIAAGRAICRKPGRVPWTMPALPAWKKLLARIAGHAAWQTGSSGDADTRSDDWRNVETEEACARKAAVTDAIEDEGDRA